MDSKEVSEVNVDSETTVAIKIRTLDSQTYTIRVDKCVPIPALKEQIAVVTGILSEQQRLICRGKVLKDDQLLSAYHVEDGHTLHLVVREPHTGPSASQTGTDSAAGPTTSTSENPRSNFGSSITRTFVFEASNAGQSDIDASDISRILTSVLDSIGSTSSGDGNFENDIREMISEGLASQQNRTNSQTNRRHTASSGSDLTVIPDSITTMSQYIGFMRGQFEADGFHANVSERSHEPRMPTQIGLPTPAALADVIHSSRQLLVEQTGESLLQIARQLEEQTNLSDPQSRTDLQRRAIRFGALMQNLGSLLLELGRTTMTLHMGQNPAEAIVNAGPATFISASRPNPLMVQAVPFNPSSTPASSEQVESGFPSRSLEIRIRRSRAPAPPPAPAPAPATATNEAEQGTTDASATNPQEQTLQASNTSGQNIDSRVSRGSIRVVYPVLAARTRNFSFGNHTNTDGRATTVDLQTFLDNAVLAENAAGSRSTVVSGIPQASAVNQQTQPESIDTRQTEANDATRTAESHNPASIESNEQGIFFSNILREIIPRISQVARQGVSPNQPSTSSPEIERVNLNGSSSSSQHEREAADAPSPKRTKRENSE